MKPIELKEHYWDPEALYQKANTSSRAQRALLGYMSKAGHLRDPIYGGAFKLLVEYESYTGLPIITTKEKEKTFEKIHRIAEDAILGRYDGFAFSVREIANTVCEFAAMKEKGGK